MRTGQGAEDMGQGPGPNNTTEPGADMRAPDDPDMRAPSALDMGGSGASDMREGADMGGEPPQEDMGGGGPDPVSQDPARYPGGQLLSPVNEHVAGVMRQIRGDGSARQDTVFIKVGDSNTVNRGFLRCLDDASGATLELDGRAALQDTIAYFNMDEFGGDSSFARDSQAAEVGRSAGWALEGQPSPVAQEIAALDPRFAVVSYGTNDMQLGATYASALWPFYRNMDALLAELLDQGVIPIVTGLPPRGDRADAQAWVPSYNAVTRALAEAYQVPYIDLFAATVELPQMGLVGDGLHGNTASGGACVFTPSGLEHHFNIRNLLTLQALDVARRVVLEQQPAPDRQVQTWVGDGSPNKPFLIDALPFGHRADTAASSWRNADEYTPCGPGLDEGGAEYLYELSVSEPTSVRAMVFDRAGVDIDLHLLGADASASSCSARDDTMLEVDLEPGTHVFALDTYVRSSGGEQPGEYLFVILER